MSTNYFDFNDTRIAYDVTGVGDPVVLLHGGGLDRRMWDEQVTVLAGHYTVIRYDLPGFGQSETPVEPFSQVDVVRCLLEALNIYPAHLLGLSVGGRIALDTALTYPHYVASLLLAAPGLSGYQWSQTLLAQFEVLIKAVEQGGALAAAEAWLKDPHMRPVMAIPGVGDRVRQIHMDNAEMWIKAIPEQPIEPPAIDRLSKLDLPTLLIIGELDVPDIHTIVELLRTVIKNIQHHTIPNAGHIISMEKPQEFNRLILDFLRHHTNHTDS